jgi:hypothetical protein
VFGLKSFQFPSGILLGSMPFHIIVFYEGGHWNNGMHYDITCTSGWGKQSSVGGAPTVSVSRRVGCETLAYTRRDPKRWWRQWRRPWAYYVVTVVGKCIVKRITSRLIWLKYRIRLPRKSTKGECVHVVILGGPL